MMAAWKQRWFRALLLLLALGFLALAGWGLLRRELPVYQGKSVYAWMLETRSSSLNENPGLKAIGTNAVPFLARALNIPPTPFDRYRWLRTRFVHSACKRLGLDLRWTFPARGLRWGAAYSLLAFGFQAEPALVALHQALVDPTLDAPTRQAVLWSLRELGPPAESLPFLLDAWPLTTNTSFWPVRHDLVLAINSWASNSPSRCLPIFLHELGSSNAEIRSVAAQGLSELGPMAHSAASRLLTMLSETNAGAQFAAVVALGCVIDALPGTVPRIKELAQGTNGQVAAGAALTLWRWGEPAEESVALLTHLLGRKEAKGLAASYLGIMGAAAKAAIPALLQACQQDIGAWVDRYDRAKCALAILQIQGADELAVKQLEGALQFHQNPWVRGAVSRDLAKLGRLSRPLLPALHRNLEDPDAEVVHAASIALKRIESAP